MKLNFGFVKVGYRGLKKNANRVFAVCALVNLFMVRRKLLQPSVVSAARLNEPSSRAASTQRLRLRQ
jgi:hypothetical protein